MGCKRTLLLFVWCVLHVIYNEMNEMICSALHLPWTISTLQIGFGLLCITPLWVARLLPAPALTSSELISTLPNALIHAAVLRLEFESIFLVRRLELGLRPRFQLIRALEPLIEVLIGAAMMKAPRWQVRGRLLPVAAGVAALSLCSNLFFESAGYAIFLMACSCFGRAFTKSSFRNSEVTRITPANTL
eukprot:CAMPEP_0119380068 /NCGR_PEP_ID=MMETSP1334-20130426/55379_1 /TAXON_ID=127549 /ORGANISM="Calcidiscus leptoporus, Strain RCC1130" /LENGTH=188 /DNA_ID=CAMNT_0007399767 /DNA_START=1 /DNA_END=564 /DNA_ORIENTATION=+